MPSLSSKKIISFKKVRVLVESLRQKKQKIIFTNGCFDIIHLGHIKLLQKAKAFGDVLILGLNSDLSIKRIKGKTRPIINQIERAEILSALSSVDFVVIFDEDDPCKLIAEIKPDVLVKGGDYTKNQVVGREIIESYGGKVKLVKLAKGLSTSAIIQRIKSK